MQTLDKDKTNMLVSARYQMMYIKKGYAFSYVQKFLLQNLSILWALGFIHQA